MSRNRMRNSHSLHWMGVLKWVLITGFISVLGLGYLYCKNQNYKLASETHQLQTDLADLKQQNNELEIKLEHLKSIDELKHKLLSFNSNLTNLADSRISKLRMDQRSQTQLALQLRNNSSNTSTLEGTTRP